MSLWPVKSRRRFLGGAALTGGLILSGCSGGAENEAKESKEGEGEEVTPAEDLMREHGILKRVLMIYREGVRRIDAKEDLPPEAIGNSAALIKRFIEDYHEKLEEENLFPRFRNANTLVGLVDTLETQHKRGRDLTATIQSLSTMAALKNPQDSQRLKTALQLFVRMYEPHEAREDTVLFPALHTIISDNEYDSLGEQFEDKEHELFGEDGFEKNVDEVAQIEMMLGIYDLSQFTPPA